MAIQIDVNSLDTWLSESLENNADTPYEIEVTGLTDRESCGAMKLSIESNQRYVDLSETQIPNSITDLSNMFMNSYYLVKSPKLPSNVENMLRTFYGCDNLKETPFIPNSVNNMEYTFYACSRLTTVNNIPTSVTSLPSTFRQCYQLVNVSEIPGNVLELYQTFQNCTSLKITPKLNEGTILLTTTFYGCTALTTVTNIPSTVTNMRYCFYGDTSINIINEWRFNENVDITSCLDNSTSITDIYTLSVSDEINLKKKLLQEYPSRNYKEIVKYNSDMPEVPFPYLDEYLTYKIDNTKDDPYIIKVTEIQSSNCIGNKDLTTENTFQKIITSHSGCYLDLSNTNLPSNITSLDYTFYNCKTLVKAPILPSNVVTLNDTFGVCDNLIESPEIPNSVIDMSCTFESCAQLSIAPNIPLGVSTMEGTFLNCSLITETPTLPDSITNLSGAFSGCTSLVTIKNIPINVEDLSFCFLRCVQITSVPKIPDTVTNLECTFFECTSLTEIEYIPSVDNCEAMISGCSSLTTIDNWVCTLEPNNYQNTFVECNSLDTINVYDIKSEVNIKKMLVNSDGGYSGTKLPTELVVYLGSIPYVVDYNNLETWLDFQSSTGNMLSVNIINIPNDALISSIISPAEYLKEGVDGSNYGLITAPVFELAPLGEIIKNHCNKEIDLSPTQLPDLTPGTQTSLTLFAGCDKLVYPPKFMKSWDGVMYGTFMNCTALEDMCNIPEGITDISFCYYKASNSYIKNDGVIKYIPESVEKMNFTFANIPNIESLTNFPSKCYELDYAFYYTSIKTVNFNWQSTKKISAVGVFSLPSIYSGGSLNTFNINSINDNGYGINLEFAFGNNRNGNIIINDWNVDLEKSDLHNTFFDNVSSSKGNIEIYVSEPEINLSTDKKWYFYHLNVDKDNNKVLCKGYRITDIVEGQDFENYEEFENECSIRDNDTLNLKTWIDEVCIFYNQSFESSYIQTMYDTKYRMIRESLHPIDPSGGSFILWANDPDKVTSNILDSGISLTDGDMNDIFGTNTTTLSLEEGE